MRRKLFWKILILQYLLKNIFIEFLLRCGYFSNKHNTMQCQCLPNDVNTKQDTLLVLINRAGSSSDAMTGAGEGRVW